MAALEDSHILAQIILLVINSLIGKTKSHKMEEQVENENDTKDSMLTQNKTVAPDRHMRAHLLVIGKYGSISYIISKQSMDIELSQPLLYPEKTALKGQAPFTTGLRCEAWRARPFHCFVCVGAPVQVQFFHLAVPW